MSNKRYRVRISEVKGFWKEEIAYGEEMYWAEVGQASVLSLFNTAERAIVLRPW